MGEELARKTAPTKGRGRKRANTSTKKERKREQNKTAALRYRMKKKFEMVDFVSQEKKLEGKNAELKATVSSMEAEIDYLKRLWADMEQANRQRQQQSVPVAVV